MKSWYVWVAFSKRKIAFDGNAPADGSSRRIKWAARFWQVYHGALSLDAHLLPPVGPLAVGSTPTSQDERGHDFWQVHPHANGPSVDGPVCVPGEPRHLGDGDDPTPTPYKKGTTLNVVDRQHHVAPSV